MNDNEGDVRPVLIAFGGMFAGHVHRNTQIVETMEPGFVPWMPRASAIIYLYPEDRMGRCSIIDLLHPSERNTPRCGNPECRCMMRAAEHYGGPAAGDGEPMGGT